jgi:transposase-like protein
MAQHFLLSARSRQLSLARVLRMTEDEAWETFVRLRWGENQEQTCPQCAVIGSHAFIRSRRQWQCRDCSHRFSVTSGTVFAHRKLGFKVMLAAVALFVHSAKGMSALQLSRNLDVQYKTAYVLFQKLREALWRRRDTTPLSGEVEMDGGYCHSYVRPKNKRKERVDRRLRENLNPLKRAVLVMRQRGNPGEGAIRTITEVIKQENDRDIPALVATHVEPGATIFADEHPAYAVLASRHPVRQVNHAEEYSADDGTNQNQAESFFTRLRRLMIGQIHKNAPKYLPYYAHEIAWREDTRRRSSKDLFTGLMTSCLATPSRNWAKYWQGNHLAGDGLFTVA